MQKGMLYQWNPLQGRTEFFKRHPSHLKGASQSTKSNLAVHRYNAAPLASRGDFLEYGMATTLTIHEKSEPLQSPDRLGT